MSDAERPSAPLGLHQILEEEYVALHGPLPGDYPKTEDPNARLAAIYSLIHQLPRKRAALCLSGGGIRSATFGLGVLQGLACRKLLGEFDYLSTVSGGGYVGSWLTAWARRHPRGLPGVIDELASRPRVALDPEPAPIRHLRAYSNYLSPRLGLLSADTWTLAAIYLRNLLLNWLVFVPLVLAALMVPRIAIAVLLSPPAWMPIEALWKAGFVLGAGAIAYIGVVLPSAGRYNLKQKWFLVCCLVPLCLAAVVLTTYWAWAGRFEALTWRDFASFGIALNLIGWPVYVLLRRPRRVQDLLSVLVMIAGGLIAGAICGYLTWLAATRLFPDPYQNPYVYVCFAAPLLLLLFAVAGALISGVTSRWTGDEDREWWARSGAWLLIVAAIWSAICPLVIFGPLALVKWPAVQKTVLAALGGLSGAITLLGGFSAGTPSSDKEEKKTGWRGAILQRLISLAAPAFFAFIVVLLSLATNWLLIYFSYGLDRLLPGTALAVKPFNHLGVVGVSSVALTVAAALSLALSGWIAGLVINTNKFSLHSMYRNRLMRAYLGASRADREPNWFTGFDPRDNLPMHELRPYLFREGSFSNLKGLIEKLQKGTDPLSVDLRDRFPLEARRLLAAHDPAKPLARDLQEAFIEALNDLLHGPCVYTEGRYPLPPEKLPAAAQELLRQKAQGEALVILNRTLLDKAYPDEIVPHQPARLLHVVNVTLNLVAGKNLAWQQRKAETFSISPLHAGNGRAGYRRSREYGGRITLGTAVAISGAAVSPNMGYYSSPAVTFLLTLFNMRLGWWLGNPGTPGQHTYHRSCPRFSIRPIIEEALGQTDNQNPYVYLSDGGHFENLGLYEMVLRRAHFIMISDAAADPDYAFGDLGNAIRRIRIDLGVPIEMEKLMIFSRRAEKIGKYCAIGRIRYSRVDRDGIDGVLIYIKPAIYGTEPVDVANYARLNLAFPHQTTGDQWFSEQQFESYRALGSHVIEEICAANWSMTTLYDFEAQAQKYIG
jgi:hypothetical protein